MITPDQWFQVVMSLLLLCASVIGYFMTTKMKEVADELKSIKTEVYPRLRQVELDCAAIKAQHEINHG